MNRRTCLATAVVTLLSFPFVALAQPLADRVPADAIVYVGWAGAEHMGPSFEQSHLKAMLDAAEVPRLINDVLPKLVERAAKEDPKAGDVAKIASDVLGPMWRHPTALYVGPVDLTDPKRPVPSIALMCQAGEGAPAMERQIEQALRNVPPQAPVAMSVRTAGDNVVVFTIGRAEQVDKMFLKGAKVASLRNADAFTTALKAQQSPVVAAYLDVEGLLKFVGEAVEKGDDQKAKREWPRLRDALGLRGLKRIAFAQGFDGKDWGTHAFLEAPSPRQGLLAGLDAEPIGDDMFRAIPASATMAGVARLDVAGLFDGLRDAVRKLDPRQAEQMDRNLAQANEMLGLNIRDDVLAPLGDAWAYYIAPELNGRGPLGVVVVNRLDDAGKMQLTSDKLKDLANEVIRSQNKDPNVSILFKQAKVGDTTVNYLATPLVTPSWVIRNQNLYVGLYPQVVSEASGHVSREGKSILDHPGFVELRKRLGGERAVSMQFYDLPKSAPTAYQVWMAVSSLGKFGDVLGVDTPVTLLPPLRTLTEHLSVAGSVSWVDDKGWHFRSVTPFPGATVLASETAGLMDLQTSSMLIGLALPALGKAKQGAQQQTTMSNGRQIAMGMMMYANDNKGRLPDKLSQILPYVDRNAQIFHSPRRGGPAPLLPDEGLADWVDNQGSFTYVLPGRKLTEIKNTSEAVVAYEKHDAGAPHVVVVFVDGHVESLTPGELKERLARQP